MKDLDVEFLGGISFMSKNSISVRLAKHEIMMGDSHTVNYNTHTVLDTRSQYYVRRTQAPLLHLHVPQSCLDHTFDITLPWDLPHEGIVAIEPRSECRYAEEMWSKPTIFDI